MLIGIVVTYRRPTLLATTLDAITGQTRPPDQLLIVDNDPDETAAAVAERYGADYLATGDNIGPAGGIDAGIRRALHAIGDQDVLIALFDDDDPPTSPTQIADLLELRTRAGDVAAVGCTGVRYDRRRGRVVRVPDDDLTGIVEVDAIGTGQFPIYSSAALRRVTVDAPLFFGFEDLDLGLQLRAIGDRLVVDGRRWSDQRRQFGYHGLNAAQLRARSTAAPWRRYYSNRSLIRIARRHASRSGHLEAIGTALVRSAAVVLRRPRAGLYAFRGAIAGVLGITGRTVEPAS